MVDQHLSRSTISLMCHILSGRGLLWPSTTSYALSFCQALHFPTPAFIHTNSSGSCLLLSLVSFGFNIFCNAKKKKKMKVNSSTSYYKVSLTEEKEMCLNKPIIITKVLFKHVWYQLAVQWLSEIAFVFNSHEYYVESKESVVEILV